MLIYSINYISISIFEIKCLMLLKYEHCMGEKGIFCVTYFYFCFFYLQILSRIILFYFCTSAYTQTCGICGLIKVHLFIFYILFIIYIFYIFIIYIFLIDITSMCSCHQVFAIERYGSVS